MNKADELRVLRAAYSESEIKDAVEFETPDFLLVRASQPSLGIEVTEAFESEGHARMRKIPGYTLEILRNQYRHRADKSHFPLEKAIIHANSRRQREVQVIFCTPPTKKQRSAALLDVIAQKASRVGDYLRNCDAVELVIWDRGIFSEALPKERTQFIWHEPSIRKAVQDSGFREIRYLLKTKGEGWICQPVRASIFAEEVSLFMGAIKSQNRRPLFYREIAISLAGYLRTVGFNETQVALHGSSCFTIFSESAVVTFKPRKWMYFAPNIPECPQRKTYEGQLLDGDASHSLIGEVSNFISEKCCVVDISLPADITDD